MEFIFVLFIILFSISIIYFMIGLHDIDTAWNMKSYEYEIGMIGLKNADRIQIYQIGLTLMFISLIFFFVSFILLLIYI